MYVPKHNSDNDDNDNEQFYSKLAQVLINIPKVDKINLFGVFNIRVGQDLELWSSTTGKEGTEKINSNGIFFLSNCMEHSFIINFVWKHNVQTKWKIQDYLETLLL